MASQGRRFDTTTIVQTLPGGPIVYFDDDGQVDADVRDRDGSPWFWRRLAEGQYHPPTTHFFKYLKHGCRNMSAANRYAAAAAPLRGTGILHGASLARSVFAETTPWAAWAVTSEVLSGRRSTKAVFGVSESCEPGRRAGSRAKGRSGDVLSASESGVVGDPFGDGPTLEVVASSDPMGRRDEATPPSALPSRASTSRE